MINLDTHKLAWAAGFFDGEGSSSSFVSQGKLFITVNISQVDLAVLSKFINIVGVGAINGSYKSRTANSKPRWIYSAYGLDKVQHIMCILWEYLGVIKRNQFKNTINRYTEAYNLGMNKTTEENKKERRKRQIIRDRRINIGINSLSNNNTPFINPFLKTNV